MSKLVVGILTKSHALKGAFKLTIKTDFPKKRFKIGSSLLLKKDDQQITVTVSSFNLIGENFGIISFKEILDKTLADTYQNSLLIIEKKSEDLAKDFYYFSDLEGCKVINQDNLEIGNVFKVEDFPSQRTLRIKRDGKNDVLIPFIKVFIKKVDINKKEITVNTIEGML